MWNGYGVCSNLASSGEPPPLHMTTLTTEWISQRWGRATLTISSTRPANIKTAHGASQMLSVLRLYLRHSLPLRCQHSPETRAHHSTWQSQQPTTQYICTELRYNSRITLFCTQCSEFYLLQRSHKGCFYTAATEVDWTQHGIKLSAGSAEHLQYDSIRQTQLAHGLWSVQLWGINLSVN